jgi:gliding motility-associated-like protein
MKGFIYIFLVFFLINTDALATHERAGEIVYKHIEGLTYEVTIITYTYAPSLADRCELEINWGDNTSSILPRVNGDPIQGCPHGGVIVGNDIKMNFYTGTHTYAGGGVSFTLSVEDPNRNYGIVNIPNSVNVPFYIETQLIINPFLGSNNSVVLLNPPMDFGCVNRIYVHNPGAYDPDGDSLSYKLTICKGAEGIPIPGYQFPQTSNSFTIDEITGDLIWDTPVYQGEYNVAFIIEEWRLGQRIGYVTRDLQIQVTACSNNPPYITTISDTCVGAGDTLSFTVTATDPDGDGVYLSATGGPFLHSDSPAEMFPENPVFGNVTVSGQFEWKTRCSHIIKNPYPVYFKAIDNHSTVQLSNYKTVNILVVGPAPENLEANALGTSIMLSWEKSICSNATGYWIYRSESYTGFVPGHCETGVPDDIGYVKIMELNDINDTDFTDDNNGSGLVHGIEYCYMVTAVFSVGVEGYASEEACAYLKKDLPIITNVSVNNTSTSYGAIYTAWSKPTELDTSQIHGPFEYRLLRKDNSQGSAFEKINTFYNLNDTIFTDTLLNTKDLQYRYKIDFFNNDPPDNVFKIGTTVKAPSMYLSINETDRALNLSWNDDVPWINDTFVVYRQNPLTFDSIGWSDIPGFTDTGLINGKEYCYKIKSIGKYSAPGLIDPIINFSQENCGEPLDNVPPCPPVLSVETNCLELTNELRWVYPDTCQIEDRLKFYIYYAGSTGSDYILLDTTDYLEPEGAYYYTFKTNPPSVVGCFSVTALDTMYNESLFSNAVCVDINECGRIWFPNVFTPNGDQWNPYFQADSVNSIHKLQLKIFNRWGNVVYETDDPFFEWDGKDQNNNQDCSDGVYFYEGIVSEYTLLGPIERRVRGSVTILR